MAGSWLQPRACDSGSPGADENGAVSDPPWSRKPVEFYREALGKPTSDPAVIAVVEQLGGAYEVGDYIGVSRLHYDPDIARSLRWEFTRVPRANSGPTHLRVLDGAVVGIILSPALVTGTRKESIVLSVPAEEVEGVLWHGGSDAWAPTVIRRGRQYLFVLSVGQGHFEGTYKFPLTPVQVGALASRPVWQELWDALSEICRSRSSLDDPATLPGNAQRAIDRICGRAR